jgi:hypothetical protein
VRHFREILQEMEIVENFKKNEYAKLNWLEKLFQNFPVFYFAKDIDLKLKNVNIDKAFIVKPSKIRRFMAMLFICLGLFGWFSIFLIVVQKILLPISIVFLILVTSWIGFVLWIFFLNPKLSYQISIDKDRIKLGKQSFEWNKVSEYLLMVKGGGRHEVTTLVIFIDDKETLKYNLTNLNKSGAEIIKQMELYKN